MRSSGGATGSSTAVNSVSAELSDALECFNKLGWQRDHLNGVCSPLSLRNVMGRYLIFIFQSLCSLVRSLQSAHCIAVK